VLAIVALGAALRPPASEEADRIDARSNPAGHALQARQSEVGVRFEQAVLMLHAKRYEEAIVALHRVIELEPTMPEAHTNLGFALLGAGKPGPARDFFEGAIALRSSQANAYYGLAVALEAAGDVPGAIGAMRTFVHLAAADDPFVRKARAALWEWQEHGSTTATGQAAPK
jgi:Flp pilus assembly protein TadD